VSLPRHAHRSTHRARDPHFDEGRGDRWHPSYPELRNCPAPSAPRILEIFNVAQRHHLVSNGEVVQVFEPELTPLQQKVLELLHVPVSAYTSAGAS